MPTAKANCACAFIGEYFYVFGGFGLQENNILNSYNLNGMGQLERLNLKSMKWDILQTNDYKHRACNFYY